jgi:hypothetical protein
MKWLTRIGEKASFSHICFKLHSGTTAIASIHTKESEVTNSETCITVLMGGLGRFPQGRALHDLHNWLFNFVHCRHNYQEDDETTNSKANPSSRTTHNNDEEESEQDKQGQRNYGQRDTK